MKWKTFLQIVLLIVIIGISLYFVLPKYEFYQRINQDNELCIYHFNKITGVAEVCMRDKPFKPE